MEGTRINIISKEGQIEESAGRRKFYLVLDEKLIEYEKKMLSSSECPHTLPMYFISEEGIEKAYYDFTGYIQLEEYIQRRIYIDLPDKENQKLIHNALKALSEILESIKGMEGYLLFPEKISIHPDTIFIHSSDGHAVFAFYPNEAPDMTLQNRIGKLIEDMAGLYRDAEVEQYFRKFKDSIDIKNPGLDGMISILGTIQREVSYIYWNTKDFRKMEEKETFTENEKINKHLNSALKKPSFVKPVVIQALFGAGLTALFLSGILDFTSFAGLAVLAAGADLWIMKKLHYV